MSTAMVIAPRKHTLAKVLARGAGIVAAPAGTLIVGLRVPPAPFPAVAAPEQPPDMIPLPNGLPAPVERLYRLTYGERVPVVKTAVLSGRGWLRLGGVTFPMRCRFIHESARNFRAYFELTFFGRPIFKVNEHYHNGKFRQEFPFGVEEGKPKNDHSAALRMWAEWVLWAPAMLLTDPDVQWKPVDDSMALLAVPVPTADEEEHEHLVVRFDLATGNVQYVEVMKYKHPADTSKVLWANAIWLGDKPWANFNIEERVYNAPVDTSLDRNGP